MIWEGIIGLASNQPDLTNQIGSSPMRLFPKVLPQGQSVFPAVVGEVVTNNQTNNFDGGSRYDTVPYDFHCYGITYKDAQTTAKILRTSLEGQSGTFNNIVFDDIRFVDSGNDDYLDDLELFTYSIEITFNIRR